MTFPSAVFPLPENVLAKARHWYIRLQDESVTIMDRQAFVHWLQADTDHQRAWQAVARLSAQLDRDLAAVAPLLRQRYPFTPALSAVSGSRRRLLRAAALVGLVLMGGAVLRLNSDWFADYRSRRGERRAVHLDDGSLVEIGSETAFSVDFTGAERQIDLRQGDAFFVVAADAARPFIVHAGGGSITALGTQFNVRVRGDDVDVVVREHAVAVSLPGQSVQRLAAGEAVRFQRGKMSAVTVVDLAAAEAWRTGRLAFTDTPLRDVIQEIERYRSGRVLITDEALADLRVTGLFQTGQTDQALRTIADTLPVRVEFFTEFLVLIRPAS